MNAKLLKQKTEKRVKRKLHIRKSISGTAAKPRISVFKSNKYFYAQAIDDTSGNTIAASNTLQTRAEKKSKSEAIAMIAERLVKDLQKKGVDMAVFDRNGYKYHGLVQIFADALRDSGLKI